MLTSIGTANTKGGNMNLESKEPPRTMTRSVLKILLLIVVYFSNVIIFFDFFRSCDGILIFSAFVLSLLLFIHILFRKERESADKHNKYTYYFFMSFLIFWLTWMVIDTLSECGQTCIIR